MDKMYRPILTHQRKVKHLLTEKLTSVDVNLPPNGYVWLPHITACATQTKCISIHTCDTSFEQQFLQVCPYELYTCQHTYRQLSYVHSLNTFIPEFLNGLCNPAHAMSLVGLQANLTIFCFSVGGATLHKGDRGLIGYVLKIHRPKHYNSWGSTSARGWPQGPKQLRTGEPTDVLFPVSLFLFVNRWRYVTHANLRACRMQPVEIFHLNFVWWGAAPLELFRVNCVWPLLQGPKLNSGSAWPESFMWFWRNPNPLETQ